MPLSHFATLLSPLGEDTLILSRMRGNEALGRLFSYDLELLSLDGNIKLDTLLGETMTIKLEVAAGGGGDAVRYFHGYVAQVGRVGVTGRYAVYHVVLRPWLWLLTRSADCRIFQSKTVPEVIEQVFRDHGFSDFDKALTRPYRRREYIVQYRESAFSFVSRLMEQEGIYYFFQHEEQKHKLVLADSYSAHITVPGYEEVPYFPPQSSERREHDHFDDWQVTQQLQPKALMLKDFNFKTPMAPLRAQRTAPANLGQFEIFDYPGEYVELKDGEEYARMRLEELTAHYEGAEASGNARGLGIGDLFTLKDFPRVDQNREYLVTAGAYHLDVGIHESGPGAGQTPTYRCALSVMESQTPFRPARETPRPTIAGPQTAIVVGKDDQEIWTDQYGRVKLHFHWDRHDKSNEDSSCWVRVAQYWSGPKWGSIHVPRIGQEVIVEFLEGDPDRPIVTGRVYNGDNMPPYDLPVHATQSGWKSRSSKGANPENFNELRFEDLKGEEQLYMQAERNMDTLVKADQTLTVGDNRTKAVGKDETTTIGQNRKETVTLNETIDIGVDRKETVMGSETINIAGPRTETLLATETISIVGARTETVGGPETITIGAARTTTIAAADTLLVGGGYTMAVKGAGTMGMTGALTVMVGGAQSTSVVGADSVDVGKDQSINVTGARSQKVGKDDTLHVGKKLVINVTDEITIKTGDASITMKKNGDIVIKGKNLSLKGSGKINAKADGNLTLKGSNIGEN